MTNQPHPQGAPVMPDTNAAPSVGDESVPVTLEDRSEYVRRAYLRSIFFNEAGRKALNEGKYDDDPDMQAIARRRIENTRAIEDETPTNAGETDITEGIPEYVIEAGMAAWDKCNDDLANYVSGVTADWDEGMIVAAIYKAMRSAELAHPAPTDAGLRQAFPDIGGDPMQGPREEYRGEPAIARLRAAYVKQQPIVPNQTALVWRADLGFALQELTRLYAWQATQSKAENPLS